MIYLVSNTINAFDGVFNQISVDHSLKLLDQLKFIGTDTETAGLDCHTKALLTVQLGCSDFQIVYDISSFGGRVPKKVKEYLENCERTFILQNAKFDLKFFYKQGIVLKSVYDNFLAEQILTHGLQYGDRGLDKLVTKYFPDKPGLDKTIRGQIITKGLTSEVITYAANDVVYLEGIMEKQLQKAKELDLEKCIELDNLFVKVLAYVEFCGMKLDWKKWKEKSLKDLSNTEERKQILDNWVLDNGYLEHSNRMLDMFTNQLSCDINWDSQKQVIPLFEKLGIKCETVNKGEKKKSIDAKKVLALQKDDFPILPLYLNYKESVTLTTTFGLNWEKFISPVTGRVHSVFRQIQDTGRMASGEKPDLKNGYLGAPNFQNLPKGQETRSCFIAEKGCKIAAIDYSSQEQRILANFSKVETLLNFYKKGLSDMHSYVAFLMYPHIRPCELEELTNDTLIYIKKNFHDQRDLAKNAGFAITLLIIFNYS